jgi:plasmid stabilization system protein ParE
MKLVWTKRARVRLEEILDYIESEFGKIARDQFRTRAKEFTQLLLEFPEIGSIEAKKKGIRGFQISKQTRVFYQIKKNRITILTLFDSRQDPRKRPR